MRVCVALAALFSLLVPLATDSPVHAAPSPGEQVAAERVAPGPRPKEPPAEKLNPPSGDIALTGDGDVDGFHLLVADSANPGAWWEVATLSEPGFSTDRWIGQYCLTGSGRRAAVVYAPREFANSEYGMYAGAFAAIVDLASGEVTKLGETTSLAYYNPACGTGETVVFSALGSGANEQVVATRLQTVDTAADRPSIAATTMEGQLSSPVPVGDRIVAAKGHVLVEVDSGGGLTALSRHRAVPFHITPDADGGIAFQTVEGDQSTVRRYTRHGIDEIARGKVGDLRVRGGAGGSVLVVGPGADRMVGKAAGAPASWRGLDLPASVEVSNGGGMAVVRSMAVRGAKAAVGPAGSMSRGTPNADSELRRVEVSAYQVRTRDVVTSMAVEGARAGELSAALGFAGRAPSMRTLGAPDYSNVPWDPDATCAVPRNDPEFQVYQPTPEQVTWAANLAVSGDLTMTRPAGFWGAPMPAYSPQGLFPRRGLAGGGRVPVQILLGILAQESNMWQASQHTADGYSGNVHQGGFYGRLLWDDNAYNDWSVNWDRVDCGYGVAQVTTGMHKSDTELNELQQQAVMVDYATNIAAGLRILEDKWNQTRAGGLVINDGDPTYLENWWFAVWAYNSGFYPESDAGQNNGVWGVGWLNNPANEIYPPDRGMFLRTAGAPPSEWDWDDEAGDYGNSKYPNYWSYPERVIGWAATPLRRFDFQGGGYPDAYEPADWSQAPEIAQPDHYEFCVPSVNDCDENGDWTDGLCSGTDGDACLKDDPSPCARSDLHCWWHEPVVILDEDELCADICGTERREWSASDTPPTAPSLSAFAPDCYLEDIPWNARVIDDVNAFNLGPDGCGDTGWNRAGSFSLDFADNGASPPTYPSKIDFHQIGGGFGGHYWFANTWAESGNVGAGLPDPDWMHVTGTWTLDVDERIQGWGQVMVHLPGRHAHTQQARYEIHGIVDGTRERYLPTAQRHNGWVLLGTYLFDSRETQSVSLSNVTHDGIGDHDIAWDAMAFVQLNHEPTHFVVVMGDSYISGEGAGEYYTESDRAYGSRDWNACRRSANSWPRQIVPLFWNFSFGFNADVFAGIDFHSVACSGARTDDITDDDTTSPPSYWTSRSGAFDNSYRSAAEGQFHEVNQLDSGVLSEDTTLVLLSIGGNDMDFSGTLEDCLLSDCTTAAKRAEIEQDIQDAEASIRSTIRQVQQAAPNAQVVVAGYPALFWGGEESAICGVEYLTFTPAERLMFLDLAGVVRDQYQDTIDDLNSSNGWDIEFVDTIPALLGHGACAEDAWINNTTIGPNGNGDFHDTGSERQCFPLIGCVSRESYHPTAEGTAAIADAVEQRLDDIGYPCVGCEDP